MLCAASLAFAQAEAVFSTAMAAQAVDAPSNSTSIPLQHIRAVNASTYSSESAPTLPPNFVLILTDDQSRATLQHMPLLIERIAAAGVVFDNAIITTPVCAPARASILSGGFFAHETGVKSNSSQNGGLAKFDECNTLATHLAASGYRTGFVGKYLHGYTPGHVPPGWSRFVANENGGMLNDYENIRNVTYGSSGSDATQGQVLFSKEPKRQYITEFQTDEALAFITENAQHPFFLLLSFYSPHVPIIPESPEDASFASQLEIDCVDSTDADLARKPTWIRRAAEPSSPRRVEGCGLQLFRGQVALLQSVDRNVERIFNTLDAKGISDRTVVFFASDNGLALGRSELFLPDKGMPYEAAIGVPFAAFFPDIAAQSRSELVAANLDIPATVFDLANLSVPTEGRSLVKLFHNDNDNAEARPHLLIEAYGYLNWYNRRFDLDLPPIIWSGIRTQRWKYVEYTTGDRELYDLLADPGETQNLIDTPGFASIGKELAQTLHDERGLAITTAGLPAGTVGRPYSVQLEHWGGAGQVDWTITAGQLPAGLALDANSGRISGVPESTAAQEITIRVTDSGLAKHSRQPESFSWTYGLSICDEFDSCMQQ